MKKTRKIKSARVVVDVAFRNQFSHRQYSEAVVESDARVVCRIANALENVTGAGVEIEYEDDAFVCVKCGSPFSEDGSECAPYCTDGNRAKDVANGR